MNLLSQTALEIIPKQVYSESCLGLFIGAYSLESVLRMARLVSFPQSSHFVLHQSLNKYLQI